MIKGRHFRCDGPRNRTTVVPVITRSISEYNSAERTVHSHYLCLVDVGRVFPNVLAKCTMCLCRRQFPYPIIRSLLYLDTSIPTSIFQHTRLFLYDAPCRRSERRQDGRTAGRSVDTRRAASSFFRSSTYFTPESKGI